MKNKSQRQIDRRNFKDRIKDFFTSSYILWGIILFLSLFILMFIIFISEQKTNSEINSIFDAIWYTLVTITTVGYGDIAPTSVIGRITAMILLIAGVAIFGALSGKFASFLFERQQKKDRGL